MFRLLLASVLISVQLVASGSTQEVRGRVVDARSLQPIADAIVTAGGLNVRTGAGGIFVVPTGEGGGQVAVRAYGYGRTTVTVDDLARAEGQIVLAPLHARALYLTAFGFNSRSLREAALAIAAHTEVNALVIDVKGDRGMVSFPTTVPLAIEAGADRSPTISSLKELTDSLHAHGIYAIARIVVFKDSVLASARPDLAVKTRAGYLYQDREGLGWTDAFRREVWEYNADLAVQAAQGGFDEIQFDYVRFPDAPGLLLSGANTQANRVAAIEGFLALARDKLAPYNVFVSADIFGYVCWNLDDTGIGQTLSGMLQYVDYLSPMLYPTTFQFGIPGYRHPVSHPYDVVYRSLERAVARTGASPLRFRPWLQAFQDYAFDHRAFGGAEVRAQITAAQQAGSNGWMLWNPRNVYSADGLAPKQAPHD